MKMTDNRRAILTYLRDHGPSSVLGLRHAAPSHVALSTEWAVAHLPHHAGPATRPAHPAQNPARQKQNRDILAHLRRGLDINPQQSQRRYGVARLASRIHELRVMGWPIEGFHMPGEKFKRYVMRRKAK